MRVVSREIKLPATNSIAAIARELPACLEAGDAPVRFVVIDTETGSCEVGVIEAAGSLGIPNILEFRRRRYEDTSTFNAVLVIPTGIGCELGGHSGDGGAVARLIGSACDSLVLHPNVVNAADINEMPPNSLYVEGSTLTRLLMGTVGLRQVRANNILLVVDATTEDTLIESTQNLAAAAWAASGFDVTVMKLDPCWTMQTGYSSNGSAVGVVENLERLYGAARDGYRGHDAVALASVIDYPKDALDKYFHSSEEVVNPWGGIEAMLTHSGSLLTDLPMAHAPICASLKEAHYHPGIVDPRKAAEAVSLTYLYCVLRGLHKSPAIVEAGTGTLNTENISCLVVPDGCLGLPVLAALEQGIPVISVHNPSICHNDLKKLPWVGNSKWFQVEDYLTAVGVMHCLKAGIEPRSVMRPLEGTEVLYG